MLLKRLKNNVPTVITKTVTNPSLGKTSIQSLEVMGLGVMGHVNR